MSVVCAPQLERHHSDRHPGVCPQRVLHLCRAQLARLERVLLRGMHVDYRVPQPRGRRPLPGNPNPNPNPNPQVGTAPRDARGISSTSTTRANIPYQETLTLTPKPLLISPNPSLNPNPNR
eukprot:4340773-Pyramimonas_sp.AAC.1